MFTNKLVLSKTRNPIFWQETVHQHRSISRMARTGQISTLLLFIFVLVGVPLTLFDFTTAVHHTVNITLVSIWVVHAVVAVRCIIAGANTISREHVGLTWDALVLTGVSARRILTGKWWAAMHRIGPWMFGLGLVRLATLPVLMYALTVRLAFFWGRYYSAQYNSSGYYVEPTFEFTWVPEAAYVAVLAALALTFLEVAACVAVGLAASALARRGVLAAAIGLSVRFLPVVVLAALTQYEMGAHTPRWYRFPAFTIADGGTSALYQFMVPLMAWTQDRHVPALFSLLVATLVIVGFLGFGLVTSLWVIRHTGAIPHKRGVGTEDG